VRSCVQLNENERSQLAQGSLSSRSERGEDDGQANPSMPRAKARGARQARPVPGRFVSGLPPPPGLCPGSPLLPAFASLSALAGHRGGDPSVGEQPARDPRNH
jgi:hypothetical protein